MHETSTAALTLALIPSPLLGAHVWQPVARVLTDRGHAALVVGSAAGARTPQEVLDGFLAALPADRELVLVPHSNAGAYVPALVARRRVVAAVFVDAVLPPSCGGSLPLAPPALLADLRDKVDPSGLLPVWTRWWDEPQLAGLFPDDATRARVEHEQQQLPLAYFEAELQLPPGWDGLPCAYLAFGDTYAEERLDAVRRGWPTMTLEGGHLHQLVDPGTVAAALLELIEDPPH